MIILLSDGNWSGSHLQLSVMSKELTELFRVAGERQPDKQNRGLGSQECVRDTEKTQRNLNEIQCVKLLHISY